MNRSFFFRFCALLLIFSVTGCKKVDDWLDAKRSVSDVAPRTLDQFQQMIDNHYAINQGFPTLGLAGTDNFYVTDAFLSGITQTQRNCYIWAKDIFGGASSVDWKNTYAIIEIANIILDGLVNIKVDASNLAAYNNIKGSALFIRSYAFYVLAQLFCKPYTAASAGTDLGIPIRLTSDVTVTSVRATVKQTYDRMTSDLATAIGLLPAVPTITMRPGQAAANALLAKVYLAMDDYPNAGKYAGAALAINSDLLDFNSSLVNPSGTYRFPDYTTGNPEVIYYAEGAGEGYSFTTPADNVSSVDSTLYASYSPDDLRKSLFYYNTAGRTSFCGTYTGTGRIFAGLANNETYLIRSEAAARAGDKQAAMDDLNTLLQMRYKTGTFVPLTAATADEALSIVLNERRKELPFSAQLRWEDLRRLNKDQRFYDTLTRVVQGIPYTLLPGDARYVYPIPDDEIKASHIQQNPR